MKIFDKLYDLKATGGPMSEQYPRNAPQLLMDQLKETYSLLELPNVSAAKQFRHLLSSKCRHILARRSREKQGK